MPDLQQELQVESGFDEAPEGLPLVGFLLRNDCAEAVRREAQVPLSAVLQQALPVASRPAQAHQTVPPRRSLAHCRPVPTTGFTGNQEAEAETAERKTDAEEGRIASSMERWNGS